ncbi:MAG: phosphomannomutase/phosphoglucomutase [Burkholderiales bacterium]|nr:phosphomannomutase/phosphoglucomutase [Anaerolineae bacterium]
MAVINPSIFRKCDVRGRAVAGERGKATLTPDAAFLVGRAFGTYLQERDINQVVIGRDNRHTSPVLAQEVINGMVRSGCHVVDLGMVSTPVVYWAAVQRGRIGGLMVTGSHLTPDMNGLKPCIGARSLCDDDLLSLRTLIETDALIEGAGSITVDISAREAYLDDVTARLPMTRSLRVVVDAGNGTAGLFAPRLLERWGHQVECLFCEPDGDFPNHHPDPHQPETLRALAAKVRETGADLGIAFDGDADRLGVMDENGRSLSGDRLLALLARDLLSRNPGARVVADVLCSQVLFDEIERAGGVPVMWKTGHGLMKAKMVETGALLGGELTGHIFPAENYFGFDDAFFAAGLLLQILANSDQPLSALDTSLPTLFSTPEYRPHCDDENKAAVISAVKESLIGRGEISEIDGLRVKFEHGWGLLRGSNTEPTLSMRFEGETEADALAYRDLFFEALSGVSTEYSVPSTV